MLRLSSNKICGRLSGLPLSCCEHVDRRRPRLRTLKSSTFIDYLTLIPERLAIPNPQSRLAEARGEESAPLLYCVSQSNTLTVFCLLTNVDI